VKANRKEIIEEWVYKNLYDLTFIENNLYENSSINSLLNHFRLFPDDLFPDNKDTPIISLLNETDIRYAITNLIHQGLVIIIVPPDDFNRYKNVGAHPFKNANRWIKIEKDPVVIAQIRLQATNVSA
jgi:hypothetical protein